MCSGSSTSATIASVNAPINQLHQSSTISILLASTVDTTMLPTWSLTDPSGRPLLADCLRSNPSKGLKSSKSSLYLPCRCSRIGCNHNSSIEFHRHDGGLKIMHIVSLYHNTVVLNTFHHFTSVEIQKRYVSVRLISIAQSLWKRLELIWASFYLLSGLKI